MYDEMLNGQPSRERLQQFIDEAEHWRLAHRATAARKQNSPLTPLRNLLVKVVSSFTS